MNLKKPKFWDYKKPNIFAYILLPIAFLIKFIKLFKQKSNIKVSKIKSICVGNIYIGGTGKTSLAIKINEILSKKKLDHVLLRNFILIRLMNKNYYIVEVSFLYHPKE
jgi:tetraacyldisaccharide 4'-kinase